MTSPQSPSEKNVEKCVKPNDICFVIMPFGGWFDRYYKEIYAPAIIEAGFEPHRADDLHRAGAIVNDIWRYTKQAKVILADLTTTNPNVLYELGLAHAITKPVIIVTDYLEQVPFDLRSLRVIEYDKSAPHWGDALKTRITNSIKETMKDPDKAVLSVFMEVDDSLKRKTVSNDKALLEIRQELQLIKQRLYIVPPYFRHKNFPRLTPMQAKTPASTSASKTLGDILGKDKNIGDVQFDMVVTSPGIQPIMEKVYSKNAWIENKMKFRYEIKLKESTNIYLLDYSTQTGYMWLKEQNTAYKINMSQSPSNPTENVNQIKPSYLGTEIVEGKLCDAYQYSYQNVLAKIRVWKEKSFPVRMETTTSSGTTIIEYKNIVFGTLSNDLFQLPAGVQIMQFPAST